MKMDVTVALDGDGRSAAWTTVLIDGGAYASPPPPPPPLRVVNRVLRGPALTGEGPTARGPRTGSTATHVHQTSRPAVPKRGPGSCSALAFFGGGASTRGGELWEGYDRGAPAQLQRRVRGDRERADDSPPTGSSSAWSWARTASGWKDRHGGWYGARHGRRDVVH